MRAVRALHAQVGLNFDDVRMAVLVQRVVPAQYAFVIHTRNPSNNDEEEVFCELVRGLGESLVSGMIAGSAIAFKANKAALDQPEVLCYASKSEGMFVRESLIFRSDSNGEDLEGYAGACAGGACGAALLPCLGLRQCLVVLKRRRTPLETRAAPLRATACRSRAPSSSPCASLQARACTRASPWTPPRPRRWTTWTTAWCRTPSSARSCSRASARCAAAARAWRAGRAGTAMLRRCVLGDRADAGQRRQCCLCACWRGLRVQVGAAIEKALGSAQDIEGVVAPDGTITVVQTRPQV